MFCRIGLWDSFGLRYYFFIGYNKVNGKLDRNLSRKIVSKTDPVPTYPVYKWAAVHRLPSPKCNLKMAKANYNLVPRGSSRTRLGKLFKVRKIRNCFSCVPHLHKLLIKTNFTL